MKINITYLEKNNQKKKESFQRIQKSKKLLNSPNFLCDNEIIF